MKLFRMFPATVATFAVVFGGIFTASAVQTIENPDDVDGICHYSDPRLKDASSDQKSENAGREFSQAYQTERRAMVQKVMEVTVSAEQLALIGYDHVTGVLSVSGFRDYPLFSGRHFLRFREGCALHFEVDETVAREWPARVRMGGAGLKIGFLLNAHDNYEQAFCESPSSGTAEVNAGADDTGDDAGVSRPGPSRHVVLIDLLYATLIGADGKELSTFHSELGHRVYSRRASRMDGKKTAAVPRVEVTSLVWTGGVSAVEPPAPVELSTSVESSARTLATMVSEGAGENSDNERERGEDPADKLDAWWRSAIEAAVYPCYQRGLARNGRLQGAFVMRMPAERGGHGAAGEVLLDTLQMDDVSSCILERVRAIRMPARDTRRWTSMKATMLFMLD